MNERLGEDSVDERQQQQRGGMEQQTRSLYVPRLPDGSWAAPPLKLKFVKRDLAWQTIGAKPRLVRGANDDLARPTHRSPDVLRDAIAIAFRTRLPPP